MLFNFFAGAPSGSSVQNVDWVKTSSDYAADLLLSNQAVIKGNAERRHPKSGWETTESSEITPYVQISAAGHRSSGVCDVLLYAPVLLFFVLDSKDKVGTRSLLPLIRVLLCSVSGPPLPGRR